MPSEIKITYEEFNHTKNFSIDLNKVIVVFDRPYAGRGTSRKLIIASKANSIKIKQYQIGDWTKEKIENTYNQLQDIIKL